MNHIDEHANEPTSGRKFWQPPSLHSGDEQRGVGWIDLFFDLFFVVVIAEIAHHLTAHPGVEGVRTFLFLFIPVWWVWIGDTYYGERFETEGIESRLYLYALMLPVIGMAVYAHDGLGATYAGFALSYAVARGVITFMWGWASVTSPRFRPTGRWYVGVFSLAVGLVVASVFVPPPLNLILFGVALALDLLAPLVTIPLQAELPAYSTARLPTRFGLFTIVVLGETVVGVVNGLAEREGFGADLFADAALGVALGLGLWWLYFDFVGRRRPRQGAWTFLWSYLHLPFVIAVTAVGAGITNVIAADGVLSGEVQRLIGGSIGVALITLALLEQTLVRTESEPAHPTISPLLKVASGLLAFAVGFALPGLSPVLFLLLLVALLLVNMVYGLWVWFALGGEAEAAEVAIGD